MVSYSDGLDRWLLFSLLSVLVIFLIFGSLASAFTCAPDFDYNPFCEAGCSITCLNTGGSCADCCPCDVPTTTPTPAPTPTPATWDCSNTYTSVVCYGGSTITNLDTSIVYNSYKQIDSDCWDFGKLSEGDYSTSGGIITVGTCQFPGIPEQNSTCVNIDGYHFMSGSKFGIMAVMIIGFTGSHAAAAPFLWMATLEAPCPDGSSPVNTTPTPTPQLTWVPDPYVPPTYVPPTPPGGEGGIVHVGFPKPTGTLGGPDSVLYPTGLTTIPTNISMPLLPVTLPDLPDQLNTTTYISFINSTPLVGPLIAYPLTYIDSLMVSINNQILFLLSFIVSPLESLTSSFVSITANIDAVLNSWQTGASLITALMWYSFEAIPTKVLNVLSLALFFDILELVFDWPEDLQ